MKKILFFILVIIFIIMYINVNASSDYDIVIPDASIRVRVVANSNNLYDQSMKMKVKKYIEDNVMNELVNVDNIENARYVIKNSISDIESGIDKIFKDNDYNMGYKISYGDNYFPEKDYKGVHYEDGEYESVVVIIGEGNGDNWWCCLFPPLCLLEGDSTDSSDVEYQFYISKILDKIFN